MSEALLAALPEPDLYTLLFKNSKQTVLLSVDPCQTFSEIKSLLLAALKSRNITSIRNVEGGPLCPISDAKDIEFGVLADRKDPSKGWVPLYVREQDVADLKLGKKNAGGKKSAVSESPEGAGLTDGSWIAFRVRTAIRKEAEKED